MQEKNSSYACFLLHPYRFRYTPLRQPPPRKGDVVGVDDLLLPPVEDAAGGDALEVGHSANV